MAIARVIQRGQLAEAYDERNMKLFAVFGQIMNYTSSSLTVKEGNMLRTYDERGFQTYATSAV